MVHFFMRVLRLNPCAPFNSSSNTALTILCCSILDFPWNNVLSIWTLYIYPPRISHVHPPEVSTIFTFSPFNTSYSLLVIFCSLLRIEKALRKTLDNI